MSFNTYNIINKKITYNDINNILNKMNIRLKINNLDTYQSALLHKSYTFKNNYEKKRFIESDKCYTVKWMKELNLQ